MRKNQGTKKQSNEISYLKQLAEQARIRHQKPTATR